VFLEARPAVGVPSSGRSEDSFYCIWSRVSVVLWSRVFVVLKAEFPLCSLFRWEFLFFNILEQSLVRFGSATIFVGWP
jgi:hypothetical protein